LPNEAGQPRTSSVASRSIASSRAEAATAPSSWATSTGSAWPNPFEQAGIPLEAIGTAIASGHLSLDFVDQMFIYDSPLSGKTLREVADDIGLPTDALTRLYMMWGLPRPHPDDLAREDDAPTFAEWKAILPPEALNEQLLTQGGRLFGEATTRLADWAMAVFRTYIEGPSLRRV
jgi:hypothetical protein